MRWHLAKKRWAKSRSEFFYDLRQNIKLVQKGIKHFFVKSKYERNTKSKAPVYSFVAILILGSLAFLAYKTAPIVWNKYKSYELRQRALEHLENNDINQAYWSAYNAYNYESKNPTYDTLKLLAKNALLLDRHETHDFLKILAHHKKAKVSDSITYIRYSLDKGLHFAAEEHFPAVEHIINSDPRVRLLHLRILARNWRLNYDEVLQVSRELVHVHKLQDPALDHIYLNIAMREKDFAKEAIAHMFQLAQGQDLSSLIALRKAVQPLPYNDFSQEQIGSLLFDYLKHPLASWDDRIIAFTQAFRRGLIPHTELDAFVKKQFPIEAPNDLKLLDLKRLYAFFQDISLPHKTLKYIPVEKAIQDKLFLVDYLMVMLESGRYHDAEQIIGRGKNEFTKSERHIFNAIVKMKKAGGTILDKSDRNIEFTGILGGVNPNANKHLKPANGQVINNSSFDLAFTSAGAKEFPLIEHLFEHLPHNSSLVSYMKRMSKDSIVTRPANILLLILLQEKGQEADFVKILKSKDLLSGQLSKRHLGRLLYLKVLYGLDSQEVLALLEVESSVEHAPSEMVLALSLAYYLNNEPVKALRTLEECKLNFLFQRPGNQVIAALIFNANDRSQDSRHFVSNLNMEALLAPERQLVLRLLQSGNQNPEKI